MRKRITLKKKSDHGQFAIPCIRPWRSDRVFRFGFGSDFGFRMLCPALPCIVKGIEFPHALCDTEASVSILPRVMADHLGLQVEPSLELFTFVDCSQKNSGGIVRDLELQIACHCGAEYESDYSESIDTHLVTSIDTNNMKSTDADKKISVDIAILDEEDKLLHHSSWKRNAPSFDITSLPSIDTQPQQRCRKRASTDTAYYKSVDTDLNRVRDGDYSIGSLAEEHHHDSFAVKTVTYTQGADKLQHSFIDEALLNMQKPYDTDQFQAEAAWEITRFSQSINTHHQQSIDKLPQQSIDNNNTTDPNGNTNAIDSRTLHVSQEDTADILQTANGADNMFTHQRSNREQNTTKEFYDTAGGIENSFKQRSRNTTHPSINIDIPTVTRQPEFDKRAHDLYGNKKFYWEEKDEYGVYRDDREFARDLDGHTIHVHTKDIRRLMERVSRDEPAYICLPEHASSFTQTKLVPEIYTKDKINKMFYGVCCEHDRNKEDEEGHSQNSEHDRHFSTAIDRQKTTPIDRQQTITIARHTPSRINRQPLGRIDRHQSATPTHNKVSTEFPHQRRDISVGRRIYRALETTEERLDGRYDDIYFTMDLNISALTSKVEAIQGELVEIQSYIARRPEASISIDRRNNKSIDTHNSTTIDSDINRGRLVPKTTSDMSTTPYHGKEISADTYATAAIKDKWRRGDEAMRDFTSTWFNKCKEEMDTCFPTSPSS
ncbi:hypothetical protein F2Q70_00011810 [Brassica cretica]|uniref:Uncharacterized protein n=1 Tax=Brassica cretica TaxID=69181 RepID=A0A8S9LYP3_BRACR|nr:hypothetical protein F2Q70_00011810 [Brassica cretica]